MIVLAAHGTRDPAGAHAIEHLAGQVRAHGVPVRVAYADVREPSVTTVLTGLHGQAALVVPAFLAAGYHVRADLPAQITASGHPATRLTEPLGPDPALLRITAHRLRHNGLRAGDQIVLAAAGSRDPQALAEVRRAAGQLARLLGAPVRIGYLTSAEPRLPELVRSLPGRVVVASWLLAPGLFHRRVRECGADFVTGPLLPHPGIAELIVRRYTAALPLSPTAARTG
ncbi:sirohydrochlorin chelatase [Sciscionella sediminilitoris]|uniref:sirohydrochlorin chelatase n=1 Tax=Sciscionella sediminilitoris TaxID=1445613 RepID=UPI0004DED6F9|nr:CbiX/SirB N-terminal domain-containing protein [Sciscionella sp. SE31]